MIPLEILFGNPQRAQPTLSPDGTRLAFLAPVDGVMNLWMGQLSTQDYRPLTHETENGIGGVHGTGGAGEMRYWWTQDGRYLLYLQDVAGDENWRLYRIDPRSGESTALTPFDGVQAQVLATSRRFPDQVLIALNKDNPVHHDVYRMSISSGRLEKVADNPGFLSMPGLGGWLVDHDFSVRGATRLAPDGGMQILVRDRQTEAFDTVMEIGVDDALNSRALGFTADGRGLYLLTSQGAETSRLVHFDLATRRIAQVLAADPRYDLGNEELDTILHPETGAPQLVPLVRARSEYVVLDPAIADDVAAIQALHPGDLTLLSRDHADRMLVVSFTVDDGPVAYYLYDRASKRGTHLFDSQPELRGYSLAKMEPFAYQARDGLRIEGYLTFPPGAERHNLPAVIAPHGGPWERDLWRCNPRIQFLATRGYLVVSPNFRGSCGYGKAHVNAADKQWGGAMHDDLVDAIDHVVAQGHADPARIGILGGSYGGYAALVAATFTPERFRCAVAFYGPSSLLTMREHDAGWIRPLDALLTRRIGDPQTERDFLWSRSPLSKVDQARIPLLIAQGANDARVKQAESDQIVAALRERGVPHEYIVFSDEGHGFRKPANHLTLHRRVEQFLAEHLGGRQSG